jgi:hypothetical protein
MNGGGGGVNGVFMWDSGAHSYYMHAHHTVKRVSGFPVPSRDVTDQTLPGQGEFGK